LFPSPGAVLPEAVLSLAALVVLAGVGVLSEASAAAVALRAQVAPPEWQRQTARQESRGET